MKDGCPFCEYEGPSEVVKEGAVVRFPPHGAATHYHYFVIEPLAPVTPGHLLVVSREHQPDFRFDPQLTAAMMQAAAMVAGDIAADEMSAARPSADVAQLGRWVSPLPACNLIVSAGEAATQTVMHLHVHVVPRRPGDGLALPWTVA